MNEDDLGEMRREVERIKHRLDDIGHIQAFQVRASGEAKEEILKFFAGKVGQTRAKLYLEVDGSRSVSEIAEAIDDVSESTASRRLSDMYEYGLIGSDTERGAKVYHHTVLERALKLTKALEDRAYDS